ncbi:UNVERIFIED_CONTAM: hypothetical protein RMT77_001781 [Armadillidium vulgare]
MDISRLICLVKEYPDIYIPSHPRHRDREHLSVIWRRIAQELKATEDDVRSKWQNLRSNFMREIRKMKRDNFHRTSWVHFEALSFLKDRYPAEPSDDPLNYQNSFEEDSAVVDQLNANLSTGNFDEPAFPEVCYFKQEEQLDHESENVNKGEYISENEDRKDKKKKTKRKHSVCDYTSNRHCDKEITLSTEINDPDLMFLCSLLPSIKKLSSFQNLEFKGEVIELLKKKLDPTLLDE